MTSPVVADAMLDSVNARSHVFVAPLTYLKGLLNTRYRAKGAACRFHLMETPLSLTSVGMYHRKSLPTPIRNGIEKRLVAVEKDMKPIFCHHRPNSLQKHEGSSSGNKPN